MSNEISMSLICGILTILVFLLVGIPLIKFISNIWSDEYPCNKKPKQSWFDKKISKLHKKHYKRTVKDIKKKISRATRLGNNYIIYDSFKLNDEIVKYFKVLGIQIEDDGFDTIFKW